MALRTGQHTGLALAILLALGTLLALSCKDTTKPEDDNQQWWKITWTGGTCIVGSSATQNAELKNTSKSLRYNVRVNWTWGPFNGSTPVGNLAAGAVSGLHFSASWGYAEPGVHCGERPRVSVACDNP